MTDAPRPVPDIMTEARNCLAAGNPMRAVRLYRVVVKRHRSHAGAWLGQIAAALAAQDPALALTLIASAETLCPSHVNKLRSMHARALEQQGRLAEALEIALPLKVAAPEDAALTLLVARLRFKSGDLAEAETCYSAILATRPDEVRAWRGRINVALLQGDPDRALTLARDGLVACSGDILLQTQQARLYSRLGLSDKARQVLEAAPKEDPRLRLEQAWVALEAGQAEAASALFERCLEETPFNDTARLGLAEARAAEGDPGAARHVLAGHETRSAKLGLKAAELALETGDSSGARQLLDDLVVMAFPMGEPDLARLFRLGEQADHFEACLAVIRAIGERRHISPMIAQFLLTRGRVILDTSSAEALKEALEHRLPSSRRAEFAVFALALFSGPEKALACARRDLPAPRGPNGARQISELLLDSGRPALAQRYLRRCVARWPNAPQLRRQFFLSCVKSGRLEQGALWIERLEALFPDIDLGIDRMQLMIQEERLEEARTMADARAAGGVKTLLSSQRLQLALALQNLDQAEQLVAQIRREPGAGRQNSAHFSTTLLGAQFNELRLSRAAQAAAQANGEDPNAVQARLAQNFFFPAKCLLDEKIGRLDLGPRSGPDPSTDSVAVPRVIFQYWNTPRPPEEVAAVMQSWQSAPEYEHTLYDRALAIHFLHANFGLSHVRAFRLAGSPAEEADFLRLCLLYRHGGIYADADDMLIGDLDRLIAEGPGLILVREPWGALSNNVICAPPGHPVLLWALNTAARSLMARENDSTWLKTGPGLLTRAAAIWAHKVPDRALRDGITLLPLHVLRGHVQPHVRLSYKRTGAYWNARDVHVPQSLVRAMTALDTQSENRVVG